MDGLIRYMTRGVATLIVLAAMAVHPGPVYKITRADGSVEITDSQPRNLGPDDRVDVIESSAPANVYDARPPGHRGDYQPWIVDDPRGAFDEDADQGPPPFPGYQSLAITSPANDQSVRSNPGNIAISTSLSPALQPGHRMTLLLDGVPVATSPGGGGFSLENVDRGTHTATAVVEDAQGQPLISSMPVTFHLLRIALGGG